MKNSSQNERTVVEEFLLDSIFEIKINEEERKFDNHTSMIAVKKNQLNYVTPTFVNYTFFLIGN